MISSNLWHLRNTHLCADDKIINGMAETRSSADVLDHSTHRGFTFYPVATAHWPCFMMSYWRDTIEEISRCVTTVRHCPLQFHSRFDKWTIAQIMLLFLWIKRQISYINYLMHKTVFKFKSLVLITTKRSKQRLLGNCADAGSAWLRKTWRTRGEQRCLLPFMIMYDII